MDDRSTSGNSSLLSVITRYFKLLIEDTRLGLAEKLTHLLGAITVCALIVSLALVMLVFVTIGVSLLLAPVLSPMWSFFIVAGFYLLLIVTVIVFRRQLIIDPIARFVSSLIVQAPQPPKTSSDDQPASVS